ncbi:MAG TPA: type II toxin-antitoxin system RelE/ParE family toxin [Spirochaetota bacterium]|nr:type II toxin-antitoxin system RelE/ParE family toxin [Spirochaetota bacterium]
MFLNSLPGKVAQKITWVLEILETQGMLPSLYFKKLVNTDIRECRIQSGSNIYRIFCFFDHGSIIVLTHGFIKKSRKTPLKEIIKAENHKNDYLFRRKQWVICENILIKEKSLILSLHLITTKD